MKLNGKKYWIIGASEGLGRELAIQLSNLGVELVVSARNKVRLDELSFIRKGCCVAVGHLNNEKESEELIILCESAHKIDNFEQSINEVKKIILTHHQVKVDHVLLLAAGALPRTSSGKIKRQESKKLFLNKELHAPQKVGAQKYFQETIKGLWSYGIDRIKEKHG